MPVFISYSHRNEDFVERLATHLIKQNTHIWVDKWNLNVGDSIISKVQEAIQESSALLVVLSKASVESEWCKKEITSGLLRELEEKKVILLPVLIEDCAIPLFLREKLYADFRLSFDKGLSQVVDSLAKITNQDQSRIEGNDYHFDWGMDWLIINGILNTKLTFVEQSKDFPYTVLTQISIVGNDKATARFIQFKSAGLEWFYKGLIIKTFAEKFKEVDMRIVLENPTKFIKSLTLRDNSSGFEYIANAESQRLGDDIGKDIIIDISNYMDGIASYIKTSTRKLTKEEYLAFETIEKIKK